MHILIVDDEPLARQRLRTLLSDCTDCQRTTVAEAGNAGEALALLGPTGGRGFDVLLLDIRMPGQSGLEAAAELADAWSDTAAFPALVFVTALALLLAGGLVRSARRRSDWSTTIALAGTGLLCFELVSMLTGDFGGPGSILTGISLGLAGWAAADVDLRDP